MTAIKEPSSTPDVVEVSSIVGLLNSTTQIQNQKVDQPKEEPERGITREASVESLGGENPYILNNKKTPLQEAKKNKKKQ